MCGRIRTERRFRTIAVCATLALATTLAMAGTAGATPLEYTFGGSNQGWWQSQDNGTTVTSAEFQPSGGNPGGRLTAKDTGVETGCPDAAPCNLLTFFSPIVPALRANYGGTAAFDLRSSVNPSFAAEFLLLPSGSEYLDGLISEATGTNYHHLSIQLDETGNWAICPYAGGPCRAPTQFQFTNLIGASDQFAVIADVGPNGIGETYDLDNVTLTDGPPPPQPPPPPPPAQPQPHNKHKKHKKKCKKHKKKHRRAAAAKKKKCKKHKKKRRASLVRLRG